MALLALELSVTPAQRELRILVVVEANRHPLLGDVTSLTICAEKACVLVLQVVAGDAGPGKIFVSLPDVAHCAFDLAVRANQRKPRLGVIEGLHAAPGVLAMTAIAFFPQPALVRIIRLVAIETAPGGLAIFRALPMATIAACSLMRPNKYEVGECMVEGFAVELNNIKRASLVVGMTHVARTLRRFGVAAMEAAHALPIGGDRLVARQAKASLRLPRKGLMTAVAVLFQVRMPRDERSYRSQLFEDVL